MLSDLSLRKAEVPQAGRRTIWDKNVRHFGVRITPNGTKTFIVLLGSGRRHAIGRYPVISLAQARLKAKAILAERTLGRHAVKSTSWDTALTEYLAHVLRTKKARTHREYSRALKLYFAFGTTRLTEITKTDIARKLDNLDHAPAQQARALVYVKTFFGWCVKRGYLDTNPITMSAAKSSSRTRVLSDGELKLVWLATDRETTFNKIVRLLLLTGQRRGEIAGLQRIFYSHNQKTICLPSELTKNGSEHTFPVGSICQSILTKSLAKDTTSFLFPARRLNKLQKPFSGWSKSKKALDKLCPIPHWTLHDLRRTFATNLARLNIAPHIIERLLNHVGGEISGVSATYNRFRYEKECRKAIERYERFLIALVRR